MLKSKRLARSVLNNSYVANSLDSELDYTNFNTTFTVCTLDIHWHPLEIKLIYKKESSTNFKFSNIKHCFCPQKTDKHLMKGYVYDWNLEYLQASFSPLRLQWWTLVFQLTGLREIREIPGSSDWTVCPLQDYQSFKFLHWNILRLLANMKKQASLK